MDSNSSRFEKALRTLSKKLNKLQIPYCIIGGLAAQVHAEPRYTRDIDITVIAEARISHALVRNA